MRSSTVGVFSPHERTAQMSVVRAVMSFFRAFGVTRSMRYSVGSVMPEPTKAPRRTKQAMQSPQLTLGLPPSYPSPPSSLLHESVSATRLEKLSTPAAAAAASISPFD